MDWENTDRIVDAIDALTEQQYIANLIAWNAYFSTPALRDLVDKTMNLGV